MPRQILLILALLFWAQSVVISLAAEPPQYRTDGGEDKALPWYRLEEGKFPPPNSAHAISGELIQVDHLERKFRLRVDRNDSQQAGNFDLPLDAAMLPFGSIYLHGAPAALQDLPLGTHLHGSFYLKDSNDKAASPSGKTRRMTGEAAFTRCFLLEDDFSHYARLKQNWKIDEVKLSERKLTATLQADGKAVGKPQQFDLLGSTRVHRAQGAVPLEALQAGQTVQFNITWATLYGPGRVVEIWIDDAARELATKQQLERHRDHTRDRGLAGWIDAVDDEKQVVTITFFGGVDPKLFDELTGINEEPHGWPFSGREDDPKAPKGGICAARESLMTYDPVNDRKGGNILKIEKTPLEPGSSGVQIQVKCCQLLEGFRPGRIVRFYPATWKVVALPREEQFHGRE
jgi:hypothetical protein